MQWVMEKRFIRILLKHIILFLLGGLIYICIELLYRGDTHWSMAIVGGFAFVCCGLINELLSWQTPLWKQSFIGGGVITVLEFISGIILNIILKWDVWDYTNYKINLLGQICLPFSILWCVIAIVAIILDDHLRYWLFQEEKPRYKFLK
ncbi:putative ABC transporter permease [Lachnoclostridium phytofermentans]|uniref:putative ABC transporter permease n=1 Tax=Lachnoclostridium phytofermentans TaxID=66219 RepID=UPI000497666C|nr:hypothetical protein [Lachnoclostridium phytofermentans]